MHRALLIPEVVQMIIRNISAFGNKTLYHAALTCSSFTEPALDGLWYEIQKPTLVFKLLSNLELDQDAKHHALWGPILEDDLKTFNKYASRVRRYCYCHSDEDVDISAYVHVLRACRRSSIFPNLLELLVVGSDEEGVDPTKIMFLMSPCLRGFAMENHLMGAATIINFLQVTAANISSLTLSGMVNDRCTSIICLLSQLQEISILYDSLEDTLPGRESLDLHFFAHLSCKKTLRKFTLDWRVIVWSDASLDCGIVEFPSLEFIDFQLVGSIGPIVELLRYVMVPGLKQMLITLGLSSELVKHIEARYWYQFFDLIGKATTDNFRVLQIMTSFYTAHEVQEYWEDVGLTVSSFPNLDNLTLGSFIIEAPFLCSLGRNDLTKIITSWPRLSSLSLACCQSELDFTALVDIAVGLPHLQRLNLPIDIQGSFSIQTIPLLAHNLKHLQLAIFIETDKFEMVQCIDRLFPYLKTCAFSDPIELEGEDDIMPLLLILQGARRDERTRFGIAGI